MQAVSTAPDDNNNEDCRELRASEVEVLSGAVMLFGTEIDPISRVLVTALLDHAMRLRDAAPDGPADAILALNAWAAQLATDHATVGDILTNADNRNLASLVRDAIECFMKSEHDLDDGISASCLWDMVNMPTVEYTRECTREEMSKKIDIQFYLQHRGRWGSMIGGWTKTNVQLLSLDDQRMWWERYICGIESCVATPEQVQTFGRNEMNREIDRQYLLQCGGRWGTMIGGMTKTDCAELSLKDKKRWWLIHCRGPSIAARNKKK